MKKIKVCLDAGHYGKYNQSPAVKTYYESDMNWKLHLLLKKYLECYGIDVIITRANQAADLGLKSRGLASRGCDLFISIHSNAAGDFVKESVDYVAVYHLTDDTTTDIDEKSKDFAKKMAPIISKVMGVSQSPMVLSRKSENDRNGDGIMNDNYYGVLNGARQAGTPGVIFEHSFHTNTRTTLWLLDDENLDALARAEAKAIAEWFGLNTCKNGDVNLDGSVTIGDVTVLSDMLSGKSDMTISADINGDGYVTIADMTELLDILSGKKAEEKPPVSNEITVTMPRLKRGDKRNEVKTLQALLDAHGYKGKDNKPLAIDGSFGPSSDYAVRNFQNAENLQVNGVIDEDDWCKLLFW